MIYAPLEPPTPAIPFESFRFEDLAAGNLTAGGAGGALRVRIELGRIRMPVRQVMEIACGAVVGLNALADGGVDIYVAGRLVARGDVVVHEGNYCIRVTDLFRHPQASVNRQTRNEQGAACTVS
jgi:flagellar motor switch protein FliN